MDIFRYEQKRETWNHFWNGDYLGRPVLCVTSPLEGELRHFHRADDNAYARAIMGTQKEKDAFIDSYLEEVCSTYYGGEAIPHMNITLGPDQYASFLGAKLTIREDHFTTWVNSCVEDLGEYDAVLKDGPGSYLQKILDFMKYARERSEDRYIVNMLDFHSNMDALSALRGPQELCYDLMDVPDQVHRVLDQVNKTYPIVLDATFKAGDMGTTGSIGWAPVYCPPEQGRFAVLQCDFSCLVSPDQAREFVIPSIREEAGHLDRCLYHYDGKDALGHLDDILAIEDIDMIQWVPGDGQPRTIEWMDLLKKIQAAGKGLWIYDWTPEEIVQRHSELSPDGLVFSIYTDTRSQADELLERMGAK